MLHLIDLQDLDSLRVDLNGFPLNPHWLGTNGRRLPMIEHQCRFRVVTKHLERRSPVVTTRNCLSDYEQQLLTLNEAPQTLGIGAECVTGSKTGQVRGHVNWFPITATGETHFESFSKGAFDHDVNIDLLTPLPNASTGANTEYPDYERQRGYHNEFYSQETLERIPPGEWGFWPDLKRSLGDDRKSKKLVDRRFAILTGVYGVDGVHGFHAELHPVFVMALLIRADTAGHETWAVMLRNQGSEGDCAYGMMPMLLAPPQSTVQEYVLDLGPAPLASDRQAVSLTQGWSSDTAFAPSARLERLKGWTSTHLVLVFPHLRPHPAQTDFTFFGTLDVDWGAPIPLTRDPSCPKESTTTKAHHPERLTELLPQYCHPPLNTTFVAATDVAEPVGRLTEDDTASTLLRMRPRALNIASEIRNADTPALRVYASPAWPLQDSVKRCCLRVAWSDAQSLSARRIAIGASMLQFPVRRRYWHQVTPLLGYYLYPHSGQFIGEGLLAEIVNYLSLLGYRLDLHGDQFFPIAKDDTVIRPGARRSGGTLALSAFLAPNTLRVGVDLTPYTIAHFGGSCLGSLRECIGLRDVKATWGWGLGLQVQTSVAQDFFVELQEAVRGGNYKSHWICNLGWLLPAGR